MDNQMKKFPANQPDNYGYVSESDSIGIYAENYSKEMELRSQSLEVQKQEAEYSFQFSKMALEMKMEGRKAQWSHFAGMQRNTYILIGGLFSGIVSLIAASLFLNKETVAIELIKMVVYISAGGLGGYGISKGKKQEISEMEGE